MIRMPVNGPLMMFPCVYSAAQHERTRSDKPVGASRLARAVTSIYRGLQSQNVALRPVGMTLPAIFDTLRLPLIGSPLFIVSGPDLVIAQCKAGIVGSFPALNARPQGLLDEWLHRITEELSQHNRDHPESPAAPYAVNQIVHKSNDRLEADLATCAKWQVPITITSLGAREDLNAAVHSWGGIVMHDVINDRFSRKAIEPETARDRFVTARRADTFRHETTVASRCDTGTPM